LSVLDLYSTSHFLEKLVPLEILRPHPLEEESKMKKGMIVPILVLSLLVSANKSSAEMRITPDGVTTPDDSAALHLNGSFSSPCIGCPEAAVISGVNTYNDPSAVFPSYGAYFSSSGTLGTGIYCTASGEWGTGVYGSATHTFSGAGVHGKASGSEGHGVHGESTGKYGTGVRGEATGSEGYGVSGYASGTYAKGVYGHTTGCYGVAVFASAEGTLAQGIYSYATGSESTGVYSYGMKYAFYAAGPGTNYGPFTGAHEVKFSQDMPEEIMAGLIVSVTGKTEIRKDKNDEISLSSTLPTVTLSATAKDKVVFGVIVSQSQLPKDHWYEAREGERFGVVNALGEGRVWVTTLSGKIEAGDYITTSEIPGYGQLQDDDLLHSYTLGKAIETIDWEQVRETVQYRGKSYKRYLIALVYTSG